ncbi:hypothetical protein BGZ81_005309, partial [Podila clonocystis]
MTLGGNVRNIMAQLGLWEEFKNIGKPFKGLEIFSENLKLVAKVDVEAHEAFCGAGDYI